MELAGLLGCVLLIVLTAIQAKQRFSAGNRTEARWAIGTVLYLCLFTWFMVDYYSSKSVLTAIVNTVPVEAGIGFLVVFHVMLLVHSIKHPPFEHKTTWSEPTKALLRQMLFLGEAALVCLYCYVGVVFRDLSLLTATETGNYAEVQRCLALGANAGGGTIGGLLEEPGNVYLQSALDHDNFRVAKLLVDDGAPVNQPDAITHFTPLEVESSKGNLPAVLFLLKEGAFANLTTGNGNTALKCAAKYTQIAKLFISKGAFLNTESATGSTALFDFARAGNASGTELLIENGAYMPIVMRTGYTPLMAAATSGDVQTVKELLAAGVNPRRVDNDGNDADWYAMAAFHAPAARAIEAAMRVHTGKSLRNPRN